MGWFDGFPFKSKEQMERERREFENRIFPFGMEGQRAAALAVLQQVLESKLQDEEKLYCYISAKDAYLNKETQSEGVEAMGRVFDRQRKITAKDKQRITALVLLENKITALEEFPTPAEVEKAAESL